MIRFLRSLFRRGPRVITPPLANPVPWDRPDFVGLHMVDAKNRSALR